MTSRGGLRNYSMRRDNFGAKKKSSGTREMDTNGIGKNFENE